MRRRALAATAVAGVLALGSTGCAFWTPVATLQDYSASDGVRALIGDTLSLDNVLLITTDGEDASLLFTATNTGADPIDLDISWDAVTQQSTQLDIDAQHVQPVGIGDGGQIVLDGIDAAPGSLFPVYFQYGDVEGVELQVPVLDGTLTEYSTLTPTPTPTPTPPPAVPTPTPTITQGIDTPPTPTAVPTPTPTATN